MEKETSTNIQFLNSPLVRRVIFAAFVPTFVVFTLFTLNQFWASYNLGKKEVETQVRALEQAVHKQMENALWGVDRVTVQQIMKVLEGNPNIAWVKLEGSEISYTETKPGVVQDWNTMDFYFVHVKNDKLSIPLGSLKIGLTQEKFLSDFKRLFYYSLIQNLFIFFALATCLTWIINKKIIRPVRNIHLMTNLYNEDYLRPILGEKIYTENKVGETEIEHLYADIKLLQENSRAAFDKLKQSEVARFKMEMELEKERQKFLLSQRLETIGQITAQVAHDFANLLTIINGKAALLEKIVVEENDRRHTESIRKATTRATSLVKKILSMTRLQTAVPVIIDPFQSLLDMQDLLKISVGVQIELNLKSDGSHNRIEVEASTFENAIINLCVNARDAMPAGGAISIEVKNIWRNNQSMAMVSVADTGSGIPEEIQLKILEPYFTTKAQGKGTGLGLAQVNDFVKAVGGTLELNSTSCGTCFSLYIPCKVQEQMAA